MTRWLLNKPIPSWVVVPSHNGGDPYNAKVTATVILQECPNCRREGPLDALLLGDGAKFPNIAVVCGKTPSGDGCGVFWSLMSPHPKDVTMLDES